jgi:hypothetical protein
MVNSVFKPGDLLVYNLDNQFFGKLFICVNNEKPHVWNNDMLTYCIEDGKFYQNELFDNYVLYENFVE